MITYTEERLGTMVISQQGKEYEIQIRRGNCLAVFIYVCQKEDGSYNHALYNFFADEKHLKNIIKEYGNPFSDEIKSVKLNMKYKESFILLKSFIQFFPIDCYYQE